MTCVYWGGEYIWCLVEIIFFHFFLKCLLGKKEEFQSYLYIALSTFIAIVVFLLTYIEVYSTYKLFIGIMLYFIYSLFFDGSLQNKIFYNVVFYVVQIVWELIIINSILYIFQINIEEVFTILDIIRVILGFILKLTMYIILKIIIEFIKPINTIITKKYMYGVWVIFIISVINMLVIFDLGIKVGKTGKIAPLLVFICCCFVFIDCVSYLFLNEVNKYCVLQQKITIVEMQDKAYKAYLRLQQNAMIEMQKTRHDINNHLCHLKNLMVSNKMESANAYLQSIKEDMEGIPFSIKTGHVLADAVLNQKRLEAEEKQISFYVKAVIPPRINIRPSDLSSVLFNTIDNAIEASMKIEKVEDRNIRIEILPKKDYLSFYIENNVNFSTRINKSQKGYGLLILSDIVDKYNGYFNYGMKNGKFIAILALKI